jgi:hypothetical protein
MNKTEFPQGGDEAKVKNLIEHYENASENELAAEDEAILEVSGQTTMVIPDNLVPAVRYLIFKNTNEGIIS